MGAGGGAGEVVVTGRPGRRVWFHRCRAGAWLLFGVVSFVAGWASSIALVWLASVYANVVSDLGAAEAADDGEVTARLDRIDAKLDMLLRDRAYHGDHGADR